ncbi:hypothetical protein [Streptomyces sp. NPDC090445]|uniref:Rv1733c family protein n=1 Tax=Streptomyces sp. NPDC090445 TaxID=3365963 RepID=UPI0038255D7C
MHHRTTGARANPLRRNADRTRTRLHVAFALACLLAVICGIAVGRAVWADGSRAAAEAARHRHATTATTIGDATSLADARQPGRAPLTVAPATWDYPAHRAHTQTVPVPAETRKGDTVRVWVDDRGDVAPAPPRAHDVAMNAVGVGTAALCGIVLAAGALLLVRLRIVDGRSARVWETEWEDVEPLWSGRLRPGQGAGDD